MGKGNVIRGCEGGKTPIFFSSCL